MTIDAVSFLPANITLDQVAGLEQSAQNGSFVQWFNSQLSEVNQLIGESDVQLEKLAAGETSNIHQVMMALEKAKTSFELSLQVRNKLLEGYHDIMRMQL